MPEEIHKTTIIVRELHKIKEGTTSRGDKYVMNQVVATKADGTLISQNLRTFDNLPKNEPVEVSVEKFQMPGSDAVSFTVKLAGKSGGLGRSVDDLRKRVEKLEGMLGVAQPANSAQASTPPPPPPQPADPPPPAPGEQPEGYQRPPMANRGAAEPVGGVPDVADPDVPPF